MVANPRYVPALVGRGEALLGLGQREMALKSLEAAVVADPGQSALRTRIEVLRVRGLQDDVADARKATEAGRLDQARRLYDQAIAASPDSPFLYREVADVARRQGDADTALRQAQKALELEPTDVRAQILLGDIYDAQKDAAKAVAAYEAALALEPNDGPGAQGREPARRPGARGHADGVQGHREFDDAVARATGGARGRAARWALQARAAAERGRDHRHPRQLGDSLDHVGHAGRA